MQTSSKFLLEIITLVSSTNTMGTDEVFSSRQVIYIDYEKKGPKIDPWGTPCFIVPQCELDISG
jgi:hypothetical protein